MGHVVSVVADGHGSVAQNLTFYGHRISVQILPDGRGSVVVYDADGFVVREWLCRCVHTIDKVILRPEAKS